MVDDERVHVDVDGEKFGRRRGLIVGMCCTLSIVHHLLVVNDSEQGAIQQTVDEDYCIDS